MTKRYKHKKTGQIFRYDNELASMSQCSYALETGVITLPSYIVEDSCDFEELKEVLFITEDGVEIVDKSTVIYYVWKDSSFSVGGIVFSASTAATSSQSLNVLYFSSKEARDNYVKENKPLLSKKDIMGLNYNKSGEADIIFIKIKKLDDLIKEKLK